jgi:polyisoprenoid-binding protein YceI
MRLAALLLIPLSAAAAPATYDLSGGEVAVMVKYDRSTLMKGHDHILTSARFTGRATLDLDDPASCDVRIDLPVESLEVDPGDARARYGLDGSTSDSDRSSIKKNALSSGQLDVAKHPTITFRSTSCARAGDKLEVVGDLTIRGQAHRVTVRLDASATEPGFKAKGRFTATHTDFGFKPYSALLGALRNDEELTFFLDVRGKRAN